MAGGGTATGQDVAALARKYRGKGQDDGQVYGTLRSLGYSRSSAKSAVAGLGPTSSSTSQGNGPAPQAGPATPPAPAPGGAPPAPAASGGSFPGMPAIKAPDISSISLTPPKKLSGGDLGGFLAGMLIYTLFLNYLSHGPEGVKGWISAKFLNQPVDLDKPAVRPNRSGQSSGLTSTRPAQPARV